MLAGARGGRALAGAGGGRADADVAVVGAGAAGLTAALFAAAELGPAGRVVLLEREKEGGKKILMSGGSRCNVLPSSCSPDQDFFTGSSPKHLRNVLKSWSVDRCREWLAGDPSGTGLGLRLELELESEKWFPASDSAREVRDALLAACERHGVEVLYRASVEGLERQPAEGGGAGAWVCRGAAAAGVEVRAGALVVASGGLSFPKVGTDGTGHRLLQGLGHSMHGPYPALTPLLGTHPGLESLAGVSHRVSVRFAHTPGPQKRGKKKKAPASFRPGFLFTHRGFSGPSVLDVSHHAVLALEAGEDPDLRVNWAPDLARADLEGLFQPAGDRTALAALKTRLPSRLAKALMSESGVPHDRSLSELRKAERLALVAAVSDYRLPCTGHAGYKVAEVTGGGVPLDEVDYRSLQSSVAPALFLCGEVLDCFGRIGGFNFLWAWTSGRLAGISAAKSVAESRA